MKRVVPVLLVVILSVLYDTNGLTLNDLYPYGEEHGDTARTANDLPAAKLLQPIDNLIGLGLNGLTATIYQAALHGFMNIQADNNDVVDIILLYREDVDPSDAQSKVYGRVTNDPKLLRRAMNDINGAFPYTCSLSSATQLIIITWIDYKKTNTQEGSNFQLVIVTNGQTTFGIIRFVNVANGDEGPSTNGIYTVLSGSTKQNSTFPYSSNPETAPNMMLNSDVPGTYIFPLNSYSNANICKKKLIQLACESMKLKGKTVPASCN